MKVKLLKDVLTPEQGVGRIGQVVEMNQTNGQEYVKLGLAESAADDAPVSEVKEDDKPKARQTKPGRGPAETKILTHETLKPDAK